MLSAAAHVTRNDYKAVYGIPGFERDSAIDSAILAASLEVDGFLRRRARYRPPVESATSILNAFALSDGAVSVPGGSISQPSSSGRTPVLTLNTQVPITGSISITGTWNGVAAVTKVFDAAQGTQHGLDFLTAVTAIALNLEGVQAGDTLSLGTSEGYVEYHTPSAADPSDLWTMEWPVPQVLEVNEDSVREYVTATRLTAGTEYLLMKGRGRLVRLSGSSPATWCSTWRAIRLTYSAGYATPADVPEILRRVTLRLAEAFERAAAPGGEEAMGASGARPAQPGLSDADKAILQRFRNPLLPLTGERDWDEAA